MLDAPARPATPVHSPRDADTLVDVLARSVAAWPTRPAVSDDEGMLDYTALDARSSVLAAELRIRGVRRGERVAIYRDRGVDTLVAMAGILKAGAAYVAVDTRYPDTRRDLMIDAAGARLVLTAPGWGERLTAAACPVVEWCSDATTRAAGHEDVALTPQDLACVMFTSGSSGRPKAIMIEHGGLVQLARNPAFAPLVPADRFGQVASVSFDTFHIETWCSLAQGAEIVVLPTMPQLITQDVGRELRRRRVSVLMSPTMAVNHIVHEDRDAFASLRLLLTGGDVLQPAAVRELLAGAFSGRFDNLYGPTETTTASTVHRLAPSDGVAGSVPIGTALDGEVAHVVDADLGQVPDGTPGRLFIGGGKVARGYLDQPGLTAARFRPDPYGRPGARMYDTGDLAVRRHDGVLEFCGRSDEQVKIRGYRVEPREAERAVVTHPQVREAAVVVAGSASDKRLVALVVADSAVTPAALREHVADLVPDYLVPSTFLHVPEIPATAHGKRDGEWLAAAAERQLRRQRRCVEPRDDIERYLVQLWEELLAVEWIGANEDFFALGGNSLLAFRSRRRIARDLGANVTVEEILDCTQLARLADLVRERLTDPAAASEHAG